MDCSYLTKQNILVYFFMLPEHTFFVWPYQNKKIKLLVLVLFIKKTDRQQSSVLYNFMQMEVFFSSKKRISLVSTAIAMNRLTLLSHLTWLP